MATSLYDLSVGCFLQTLAGVATFLERGRAHFADNGIDADEIANLRLFPDMKPFRFQLQCIQHNSIGAIDSVRAGTFSPPGEIPALGYGGLQKMIADAQEALLQLTPAEVNAFEGKDVVLRAGDFVLPFVAENFILSFSLPNFHFHATTAYDILRTQGVPLGKIDYLGNMRIKS